MEKTPLIITAIILVVGIAAFAILRPEPAMPTTRLHEDIILKANYLEGNLKLFALADSNALSQIDALGKPVPRGNRMVIGNAEARMMQDEKLITGVGSTIDGFFGTDVEVGGILAYTGSPADDMHFLSQASFEAIQGEDDRVYVQMLDGMPKLFYRLEEAEQVPMNIPVAEGSRDDYKPAEIDGTTYYPIMIGAAEAAMMRNESLFSQPGDTIDGFFGKNVVVVAVLGETGTALDMAHVTTFGKEEWR